MKLRWCGSPLLLLLLLIVEGISAQDDFSDKCCKLGTSWANQKLSCSKFTGPVAGVDKAHQAACLETVDSCCRDTFQRQECDSGKADAKAGRACAKSPKAPPGLDEVRRDCCEGCKLGIESGGNKSCGKKAILKESWSSAFTECCEEKLTNGSTRAASSTTRMTKTTATTATTEDDELAELFKDITDPTFATQGDLCQLMKGLLCSDICVPTPGSYYCKCRDGSALQPDGRSCESPTTTTKKVTKTTTKRATKKSTLKVTATKAPPKTTTKAPPKTTTKAPPKTTTTKAPPKTTTKAPPKTTTTKATPKTTTTKAPPKTTTKASPKTTTTTTSAPKTTKDTKKATKPLSPLTTLKLLTTRAKTRTTRALATEDNELNQSCPTGYRLNPKSTTCDDTPCPDDNDCVPVCEFGYRWNATLGGCDDVDECAENSHKCIAESEICRNLVGSFECEVKCEEGFVFNSFYAACLDWNECSDQQGSTNPCPQDTVCVNTLGSYECKSLVDDNADPRLLLPRNSSASDYDGIAEEGRDTNNVCAYGFTYNSDTKSCDDIDECEMLRRPCAQDEVCRNHAGGYDCVPAGCHRGFARDNASDACVDVDECADEALHSCLPGEICRNTNGSFTCEPPRPTMRPSSPERPAIVCRKGYKADYELDGCVDVDECTEGPGCRDHERCVNFQGTYDCSPLCGHGWYFDMESKTCQDVDECMLGHHNCRQRTQYCRNTKGSHTCEPLEVCAPGYRRSPQNGSCVDVDECHEGSHSCSRAAHRYCVNREGGYECITRLPACSPGFEYSLLTRDCRDEDECRSGRANCDARLNERCVNLPGTYRCERSVPALRRALRPACPGGQSYDAKLRMCAGKATQ